MRFYSTAGQFKGVTFQEAVLQGLAPDGGLYLPESLPHFSANQFKHKAGLSFPELSIELARVLFEGVFTAEEVTQLCEEAFNFPLPLVSFPEKMHLLELFHGPTLSFKDVGCRFLGALFRKWSHKHEERIVLVATSGDTGSAVGMALRGIPGVRVIILYPKGRITPSQEQQITTIGSNVKAVRVDGSFEECQNLLRQAILDPELQKEANITTANSQNIARILSQALYYFYAYSQLPLETEEAIFSVPCGNFGHLVSGMLAKRMGLPVSRFIGATNANNAVPLFLHSGVFRPHDAYPTLAVSMDVGNPSNFPRMLELYEGSLEELRRDILGVDFTDPQIQQGIQELFATYGYLLDPHSATAYLALREYMKLEKRQHTGVFFATAHPAKFLESLTPLVPASIHVPESLLAALYKPKSFFEIPPSFEALKELLI